MATQNALTPEAFAARLDALVPPKKLALALSGGRDSVALLQLCADYARRKGLALFAYTVDHGLRAEAGREAQQAAGWARAAGAAHRILKWTGDKPASGVQAAARKARYRLMIEAAQADGCEALVTAHTLDDQAETLFMRLSRGAGTNGLAAMREETLAASGAGAPIRLLRPLLSFSRENITQWLGAIGQDFVDDPSNLDPTFERVRVRAVLAALGEQDLLTGAALAETAAKAAKAADRLAGEEDALFDRFGGCFYGWGGVSLDRWRGDAPGSAGLARRLIHAAGGGEFAPDEEAAADAVENAAETGGGALGGALIRLFKGRLWFLREPAALLGRAGQAAASPEPLEGALLWDRRFIISVRGESEGLEIAPLGTAAPEFLGARAGLFRGPAEGLSALPGLYQRGVLIGAPSLPFMGKGPKTAGAAATSLAKERYMGGIVRFY
ncbi:tRNA lysidine(34) synthetase TilS [Hyphococcus luteus]|uniref:tRNA(Ile)-lysidine synthase n=1 Tax=Hyphococcus luteus TaxID=2058213 RepID=A0A2S7K7Z7_9PROT|nr:tRNA lysidine(34) synthetase TilS [Marinicaulis flavus]PQA88637.1 tRNA lysidine(34) synthetase TilS [Marinicaulis flavus]